jgi:hypothetical protein
MFTRIFYHNDAGGARPCEATYTQLKLITDHKLHAVAVRHTLTPPGALCQMQH